MGLFDRFKKRPPTREFFPGTEAEFGEGFDEVVTRFIAQLTSTAPIIEDMGPMVLVRSPVLVVRGGALYQPASILPREMLSRFWAEPARAYVDSAAIATLTEVYAGIFAAGDDDSWARECLSDTHDLYVSDEAPVMPWPSTDLRLRGASLLVADLARKLSAGFDPEQIRHVYSGEATPEAEAALAAMQTEEAGWLMGSLAG